MTKNTIPYKSCNRISQEFVNEVYYRTNSAMRTVDILCEYQDRKPKNQDECQDFKSIRYIYARFAILEIASLIDGTGKYSIKLSKNKNGYIFRKKKVLGNI